MRSSLLTIPKSPCSASVGLRKTAFVPVETRVWEIFCAIKPLLPTPVNRIEPVQARQACQQRQRSVKFVCQTQANC